ncbi:PREDICTED: DNA-directed RNA polymerase III subunit RPC4 [Vollenhovia emeryi]|uniref:DNA-directed RNA polymerase III subunit RPC4 n=1 Tax=Vollenhovia emeryi TaxID=411798 RepID=UPI0005F4004A|nr:PREDICTED: DNA-directed RNA polymerase III subunit RPC4 [Vollenhovia emeryi]
MASNNSVGSDNALDGLDASVRVKIEPGAFVSEPSTSSEPFMERVTSIKVEPGLPTTTQRLTSFRIPRDLTLGGNIKIEKPKKVYTPNLNVQRNKKKDEPVIAVKTDPARSKNNRGRERGRGDRGRGRGSKGNIIESVGVWSEGIYTSPAARRRHDGPRTSSDTIKTTKSFLEKPKLDTNKITDNTEREKRLKHLLTNDFVDDCFDADNKMYPLTLPRVKKETNDTIDDDDTHTKPVIAINGEVENIKKERKQDKKKETIISQIVENSANSYTLIQFPESLPGLVSSRDEALSKPSDTKTHYESGSEAKLEPYNLDNLRSGLLGKLEIFKSGRARLRLGEMSFFVDIGSQQHFQQDLLAVKVDTTSQTGDLINLGPVNNKIICSPDFESMLDRS